MRYRTIAVAAAAAGAAAAGSAAATTPAWLTLVQVETDHETLLPGVCGAPAADGTVLDPACRGMFGADQEAMAEQYGTAIPETPTGYGSTTAINADLRDTAAWQVCGVAVAAESYDVDCDNTISEPPEPASTGEGLSLVHVDLRGAFNWSVCGVTVLGTAASTDC